MFVAWTRLLGWMNGAGGEEGLIHRAGAIAFGVEGDVEEAEWLDGGGNLFEDRER